MRSPPAPRAPEHCLALRAAAEPLMRAHMRRQQPRCFASVHITSVVWLAGVCPLATDFPHVSRAAALSEARVVVPGGVKRERPYTLPTRQAGSTWSGSGHGAELGVVGGWLGPSDQEEIAAAVMLLALHRRCKRSHSWARRLAAVWQARSVANVATSTGPILGDHRVAPVPHICYVT